MKSPEELRDIVSIITYEFKVSENSICKIELTINHSQNAITVKIKDQKVTGHVPEGLAFKLLTQMKESMMPYRLRYV